MASFLLKQNSSVGYINNSCTSNQPSNLDRLVPCFLFMLLNVVAQLLEQKLFPLVLTLLGVFSCFLLQWVHVMISLLNLRSLLHEREQKFNSHPLLMAACIVFFAAV